MTKTALDLNPQEWKSYQLRPKKPQQQNTQRWQQGWELARILANQLREKFGAKQVVVFGSLLHLDGFHSRSDIDLAVWGIPPEQFYQAVAAVTGLSEEFEVDLVDAGDCLLQLKQVIDSEGISV